MLLYWEIRHFGSRNFGPWTLRHWLGRFKLSEFSAVWTEVPNWERLEIKYGIPIFWVILA